ncbi:bursicon-like isoform X1 [Hydractinia symbiolongicarpus]|uniref:bursicon-like isoform X1 n=2 Tax=Hydractinia symbiolongicarpus TaxID=13093 RepID=UPI00254C7AF9|nr:bursicon-like isoform X1 [Hydractinia symbiolongicarpus]
MNRENLTMASLSWFVIFFFIIKVTSVRRNPWEGMDIYCKPETTHVRVEESGCVSAKPVPLQYCRGNCRSATLYEHKYPYYRSVCQCCKAIQERAKFISLECPAVNGKKTSKIVYRDTVTKCACATCKMKKKK